MLEKIIKTDKNSDSPLTFEIGSNSDLILENTITENLEWTIPKFINEAKGNLTFPTKFDMVDSILNLNHDGRIIIRMSINPSEIIQRVEFGTSSLDSRIKAINKLQEAGYKVGILLAPIVLVPNWENLYKNLIVYLSEKLSPKAKKNVFFELIFMTYSYIHKVINNEAFPNAIELYNKDLMVSRGYGKYTYNENVRKEGTKVLTSLLKKYFGDNKILYIV